MSSTQNSKLLDLMVLNGLWSQHQAARQKDYNLEAVSPCFRKERKLTSTLTTQWLNDRATSSYVVSSRPAWVHETLLGYFQICYCCFEICSNNAAPVGLKICHVAQVFNNNSLASTLSAGIRGRFHSARLCIYWYNASPAKNQKSTPLKLTVSKLKVEDGKGIYDSP